MNNLYDDGNTDECHAIMLANGKGIFQIRKNTEYNYYVVYTKKSTGGKIIFVTDCFEDDEDAIEQAYSMLEET